MPGAPAKKDIFEHNGGKGARMSAAKISPLMDQYNKVKEQYKDAILLFRIGDFYETFGEDAVAVARDLNITLTSRQRDDQGNRIPLAGVPYHALDAYLVRLVKAGHKVAICDQVEDPKLAKGLVKREITRVVTPGTVIEPSMLEEGSNNFLASLVRENGKVGLALVDVSTGEFLAAELLEEQLNSELAKFRPAECIASFSLPLAETRLQILPEDFFSLDKASSLLEGHFGPGFRERFGLVEMRAGIRACGGALAYLHTTHLQALGHIDQIRIISVSEHMVLDEVTLRNLEILRNIRDRSRRGTLLEFMGATRTPMGSRTLVRWIQMPLRSLPHIKRRLESTEELCGDLVMREGLVQELKEVSDLERLVGRVSCGAANPRDLAALNSSLQRLPALHQALERAKSAYLQQLQAGVSPLEDVVALIEKSIVQDPPAHLREGGVIREGCHQELDSLRALLKEGKGWILRLESEERRRTGIKSLKVGYTNVFGYYLEVSRANLHLVPQDYIRKQTLANAERFITPELKDMEARVISAQDRLISLEQEIFARLKGEVAARSGEIKSRAAALGELDVLCAFAIIASENSLVRPEWNEDGRIVLRGSRHPVLDKAMRGSFVPNDANLDGSESRLIILTGPNMSGKSTFMRQIALALIMAQAGSFVPAQHASLCLVDRIFTRVGAYDDLSAGQSTFMVEMSELANILSHASRESLVLLDEVGRGTSTFDGLSIAWAISEHLHNVIKCKAIFATHYHQLTQLEGLLPGIKNYSIAVKEEKGSITFLRTVVPGATDKSYGVHVARLAGVPEAVTRRADAILREIEREADIQPLRGRKKAGRSPKYTQLIFFDTAEKEKSQDPVLEEILDLDLDSLSPREALNRLAEFQRILRDKNGQDQVSR
jgi:DNA mismatch repair protein MutS